MLAISGCCHECWPEVIIILNMIQKPLFTYQLQLLRHRAHGHAGFCRQTLLEACCFGTSCVLTLVRKLKIRSQIIQMVVQSAASAMVGESSNTELLLSNSFIEAGRWGDKRVPGRVQAGGPQLGGADAVAGCSAAVGGRGGARGGRVRPPQPFLQRGPPGP